MTIKKKKIENNEEINDKIASENENTYDDDNNNTENNDENLNESSENSSYDSEKQNDSENFIENNQNLKSEKEPDSLKIIKNNIETKNVFIGQSETIKGIRLNKIEKVYTASNIPSSFYEELTHYCDLNSIPIEKLKITNEELGILCKRQFLISVVAIKK